MARLKPETVADLTAYVKQTYGLFGSLHLKDTEQKCPCPVCAAIRKAVLEQSQPGQDETQG